MRTVAYSLCLLAAGCVLRSYEHDPVEINDRYSLEFQQPCSSWLKSPRTGYTYCASPPFHVEPKLAAAAPTGMTDGPTDEASLVKRGETVYGQTCAACHQADGKGTPGVFPPLAGSAEFYGDARKHASIVVKGLSGEITVQGQKYNNVMPPQAGLSDYDLAAVLTFERNSWGNDDGVVLPEDVKAVR